MLSQQQHLGGPSRQHSFRMEDILGEPRHSGCPNASTGHPRVQLSATQGLSHVADSRLLMAPSVYCLLPYGGMDFLEPTAQMQMRRALWYDQATDAASAAAAAMSSSVNSYAPDGFPYGAFCDAVLPPSPLQRLLPVEADAHTPLVELILRRNDLYRSAPYIWGSVVPLSTKKKGGQIRFSAEQTLELERLFECHKYLSPADRKQLSRKLQLSERQVKTWYQNRRAKWRRYKQDASKYEDTTAADGNPASSQDADTAADPECSVSSDEFSDVNVD